MKICMIGATGHINYLFESIDKIKDAKICACAKGSIGENIDKIPKNIKRYDSYIKMLEEEKPQIAVVSPFFCDHAKVSKEALKRDIHVFSEKPVATSFEQLDELTKVYKSSKAFLGAMFGIRYQSEFLTAKKLIQNGEIGQVRLINTQKSYKLGTRDDNYKERKIYGGTIPWVGSHAIDWIRWMVGKEYKTVYAKHSNKFNNKHNDLEVSALILYELQDEILASVSIDYLRPKIAKTHADDRIRLVGTKGILEILDKKVYLINDKKSTCLYDNLVKKEYIFEDFVNYIKGDKSYFDKWDAIEITKAALYARESADSNKVIDIL